MDWPRQKAVFRQIIIASTLDPHCQPHHSTETLLLYCTTCWSKQHQNLIFSIFLINISHLYPYWPVWSWHTTPLYPHTEIHEELKIYNLPWNRARKLSSFLEEKRNSHSDSKRAGTRTELDITIMKASTKKQMLNQAVLLLANVICNNFNIWEWYTCVPFENLRQALITSWVWAKHSFQTAHDLVRWEKNTHKEQRQHIPKSSTIHSSNQILTCLPKAIKPVPISSSSFRGGGRGKST